MHEKPQVLLLLAFFFLVFEPPVFTQTTFQFNALADLEFSKAGSKSHFYYNEIDQDHLDARFGIAQLNLIGRIDFGPQWTLDARVLLEREKGRKLENIVVPQFNLQWLSKERKTGITIGRFINPFGSFNQKQLSTDRDFIGLPLAYAYYVNVSDRIGFSPGMGDVEKVVLDGTVQWGSTPLYYGGYTTGAMFSWNIKPGKVNWKVALVNGSSNLRESFTDPLHIGLISRLKVQPAYFWEQGFSVSHGTFMQKSDVSDQLTDLRSFSQTILGTDFKLGKGFFELSGEVMGVFYKVPFFDPALLIFETGNGGDARKLKSFAAYLDIKYEPPILPGSYIAYRIDHLNFNGADTYSGESWDNDVLRHSLAMGYHVNRYILVRAAVSTQHVDNKQWDTAQRTFRLVVTAHY